MSILDEFDKNKNLFEQYANSLKSLLASLIENQGISVHTLDVRVKERRSLEQKIIRKNKYTFLSEITDIVGIRVITHYSNDVDKIAEVIEREFSIDWENSIDKRKTIEHDRFGYLSLHYIISHNEQRCALSEYSKHETLKAEIQIRSILQHAWAEIEHDIGYKSNIGLPPELRRKFSRLAGLLEIADNEFTQIKSDIENHRKDVNINVIGQGPNIPLDVFTLREYLNTNLTFIGIAKDLSMTDGINIDINTESNEGFDWIINSLNLLKITSIQKLDEFVHENSKLITLRVYQLFNIEHNKEFWMNLKNQYLLGYLCQVVIAQSDHEIQEKYFKSFNVEPDPENMRLYFEDVLKCLGD